jgi:hypothetical protein
MTCGLLPAIDKQLLHFEARLHRRLTTLHDDPDQQPLHRYATWRQLPHLQA